jgi:hypothetical protein
MPKENQAAPTKQLSNNTGTIMKQTLAIVKGNQPHTKKETDTSSETYFQMMWDVNDGLAECYPVWKPAIGKPLKGEYCGHQESVGLGSDVVHILVLQEDGKKAAFPYLQWLKNEFNRKSAKVGDYVGIAYLGKSRNAYGQVRDEYSVVVKKVS